jgi:methylated-DNA-[protein]-cysteine S-methyltransferase
MESDLTKFEEKVLNNLKLVPCGAVTTYGELARASGCPKGGRAIGNALNKNPWAPKVPCHRVVKFNGVVGGYAGGAKMKCELLRKEGILIENGKILDFNSILYNFS